MSSTNSAKGQAWEIRQLKNIDEITANNWARSCKVSDIIARYVLTRHNFELEDLENFLNPKLKYHLANLPKIKDITVGAELLISHIEKGSKVAIFGDYDVDGACSNATLKRFLLHIGVLPTNIITYIPDRVKEGYGPNCNAILSLHRQGAKLIISVDCGTVSFEPINLAKDKEIDFIVIDHHKSADALPVANAIINPNRGDDDCGLGYLCATGVAFLFCIEVAKIISNSGNVKRTKEFLLGLLDIVGLATVCDVVPLIGLNRAFVRYGLNIINNGNSCCGISSMCYSNGITNEVTAKHFGFNLGPLINAGGRVGDSAYGANLLTCDNQKEAEDLVQILLACNVKRIEMERKATKAAIDAVQALERVERNNNFIFEYAPDWHEGIIGIVASRVCERYNKLTIIGTNVKSDNGEDAIKVSCRSVKGVNVGKIVIDALEKGLLTKGGGHFAAAGFTVLATKVGELKEFIKDSVNQMLSDDSLVPTLHFDGVASLGILCNPTFIRELELLEPFGQDNQAPLFLLNNIIVLKVEVIKEEHLKFLIGESSINSVVNGKVASVFLFRSVGTKLGTMLQNGVGKQFDLICSVGYSTFNGTRQINITIEDAKPLF